MGYDLVVYQFSRSKVEQGDFSPFLDGFSLDKLPTGRRLREMMGCMSFCIEGYDRDPREIHSIPEVRQFYAAFHQAWPYWLYFCTLQEDGLKMMVTCCLNSFAAVKIDGQPNIAVEPDPMELLLFIARDFVPMNLICERAGMFEERIYERSKEVFEYFGLPFDAPPPPPGRGGII